MKYRNLGASGLKVSEISLGSWITCCDPRDMATPEKIIDRAYELGVNFFDTADAYHDGNAETILGKALGKFPRESCVIATKVYWPTGGGPNDRGLSRKHIFAQAEASLKRLRTDYIDLYYCHWYDADTPVEETLRAMDDLVRKGVIRYYGVSNWTAAQIACGLRAADKYLLYKFIANQPSYSILDRYIEAETIPLSRREGIGQAVYSPLAQGVLTGKYSPSDRRPEGSRALNPLAKGEISVGDFLTDPILRCVEGLKAVAAENGVTLAEMSLAWALRDPIVASAVTGASRPEQVEANVRASGLKLSGETLARIDKVLEENPFYLRHNIVPWDGR
ncbi:MAG: aldo/keto reductase family protein [Firmicutes bacterium]|nr:aldo/keto reductase family protein [Bacillota bacterium]